MKNRIACALATLGVLALVPFAGPAATAGSATARSAESTEPATRVLDARAAQRLRANRGLTLQWIDWNRRGTAQVTVTAGRWHLSGEQRQRGGPGVLMVSGRITEIGPDYFLLDGMVRIVDAPDRGRICQKQDVWRFAVTQNRRYWRLRTFEWCDGLTDYVDIYF